LDIEGQNYVHALRGNAEYDFDLRLS